MDSPATTSRRLEVGAPAHDSGTLRRVSAADHRSMEACVERFGGLVWTLARRLSPTSADAEDAVQEIFLDVWKSAARYDPSIASESAFVAMIARRRLIDRQRRVGRRPSEEMLVEEGAGTSVAPLEPGVDVADDAAKATRAFALLAPDQQRVLRLAIHHGLSHDKIARATGMPLGTVKTHARRGLIRLRELMGASPLAGGEA